MNRFWETVLAIVIASTIAALIDLFILERVRRRLYCNS
jgi:hypothetical protein